MIEDELRRVVEECRGSSELEFVECIDLFDEAVLQIRGGRNGEGKWNDYLRDLSELVFRLEELFDGVYIESLMNDVGGDHFECRFELKRKKFD